MQRKLIRQGNNSYTITLPIKWIRSNNLDETSPLFLEQKNNSLVLKINTDAGKEKISRLNITGFEERKLRIALNNRYRSGCTKILLEGKTDKLNFIEKFVSERMLGFEVVEIEANKITISNIAEPRFDNLNQIIRKIFFIIKQSLVEKTDEEYMLSKLNNYANYCMRVIINTNRYENKEINFYEYSIISRLILIQHAILRSEEEHEFKEKLIDAFDNFHKAYFSNNLKQIIKSHDKCSNLFHKTLPFFLEDANSKNFRSLYHLAEASRHLYLASVNRLNLSEFILE